MAKTYKLMRKPLSEVMNQASDNAAKKSKFQDFMNGFKDKAIPVFQRMGEAINRGMKATGTFVKTKAQDLWADTKAGAQSFAASYQARQEVKKDNKLFNKMQKYDQMLQERGQGSQMRFDSFKPMSERIREAVDGLDPNSAIMKARADLQQQLNNVDAMLHSYGAARANGDSHFMAARNSTNYGFGDNSKAFWAGQQKMGSVPETSRDQYADYGFSAPDSSILQRNRSQAQATAAEKAFDIETDKFESDKSASLE